MAESTTEVGSDVVDRIAGAWDAAGLGVDTTPIQVVGRILRGARLVQMLADRHLVERNLVRVDFDVLSALRRLGRALTPTELGRHLLMSAPSVSQRLGKLEARGLLTRRVNPHDRRGFLIELTGTGQLLIEELLPLQLQAESRLLDELPASELAELSGRLRTLLSRWERDADL